MESLDVICGMEAAFFVFRGAVITVRELFLSWVTSIIWDVLLLVLLHSSDGDQRPLTNSCSVIS